MIAMRKYCSSRHLAACTLSESFDFASCLYLGEEGVIEAPLLHDALTQRPVPWRMLLDWEKGA